MYKYGSANYRITALINQESCYSAFMPVAKKEKKITKNKTKRPPCPSVRPFMLC